MSRPAMECMKPEPISKGHLISGRYEIQRFLGSGGMGAVYLATDTILGGREVAIKILLEELAQDEELAARFLREVQLMHQVNHANVVRTYDVGMEGHSIYFTMEYVNGYGLVDILDAIPESGQLPFHRIANLTVQMCRGLQAIHGCEILHRDFKPQNILLMENDFVKITDFGAARPKKSNLTMPNVRIGSAEYMAPEIWTGDPMTSAVDIYSLGIILYELATGRLPFSAKEPAQMMWQHLRDTPEAPITHNPDLPKWYSDLVMSMLEKKAENRPGGAGEIAKLVRASASGDRAATLSGRQRKVRPAGHMSGEPTTVSETLPSVTRNPLASWSKLEQRLAMALGGAVVLVLLQQLQLF